MCNATPAHNGETSCPLFMNVNKSKSLQQTARVVEITYMRLVWFEFIEGKNKKNIPAPIFMRGEIMRS